MLLTNKTNAVMEPTLAMHSLMNVQRKTEPVTVQKQVDGKQQVQTTQVQRNSCNGSTRIYNTFSYC